MKLLSITAAAVLLAASLTANAGPARGYFILESAPPQQIDIHNDGRNTFIQAVPGLVVPGATHDGDRYIVRGLPREIPAVLSGKPITITQDAPAAKAVGKDNGLNARLESLEKAEKAILSKLGGSAEVPKWEIRTDDTTLQGAIQRWGKAAGWQVFWDTAVDYPAKLNATFTGTFEEAADAALRAFRTAADPLQGCFYDGNKVFRVFRFGERNMECQ